MKPQKGIQPIVILGMHRSGTTMITEILEQLGLFVGDQKDDNCESLFFYKINKWAFRIGISKIDMPDNMKLMSPACKTEIISSFDYFLGSWRRWIYLGKKYFFRYKNIKDLDFPWGWKEPLNTFTIDLWKEIFPEAKIIHIYRNPMDSAASFIKRDAVKRNSFKLSWKKRLKRFFLISNKYHQNFRLTDFQPGYDVWQSYINKAFELESQFENRILTIKYEDFLDDPIPFLQKLVPFCGLSATESQIKTSSNNIKVARKFAFQGNSESVDFYNKIKNDPIMVKLGYNNI